MQVKYNSLFKNLGLRSVWILALPMIISNISVPLLGVVNIAVVGHAKEAYLLSAVAIGGLIFDFLIWSFNFLRMGTTGLVAQAYGRQNEIALRTILLQGLLLVLVLSVCIFLSRDFIANFSLHVIHDSPLVEQYTKEYFLMIVWSVPAVLSFFVFTGWFVGMQKPSVPLAILLVVNVTGIALDLILVKVFDLKLVGLAIAFVVAQYLGLILASIFCVRLLRKWPAKWSFAQVFDWKQFKCFFDINKNIFIRTFIIILVFAFFAYQGANQGSTVLAANIILLKFQQFTTYALDGFANAAEALVGRAIGMGKYNAFIRAVRGAGLWSVIIATLISLFYAIFADEIVHLITDVNLIADETERYLMWTIILPLVSVWSFLFDGIFVGATLGKEMRNTMLIAAFFVFLPVWALTYSWGNNGLWFAFITFFIARGIVQTVIYKRFKKRLLAHLVRDKAVYVDSMQRLERQKSVQVISSET